MITDRGTKKWTTMMLPEHVKFLRDWDYHEKNDEEKPELCDQQYEIMDGILISAMQHCFQVHVNFYDNGLKKSVGLYGEIKKSDTLMGVICLLSEDGFSKRIRISEDI